MSGVDCVLLVEYTFTEFYIGSYSTCQNLESTLKFRIDTQTKWNKFNWMFLIIQKLRVLKNRSLTAIICISQFQNFEIGKRDVLHSWKMMLPFFYLSSIMLPKRSLFRLSFKSRMDWRRVGTASISSPWNANADNPEKVNMNHVTPKTELHILRMQFLRSPKHSEKLKGQ